MDRKSILVIVICFALYITIVKVSNHAYPPKPAPVHSMVVTNTIVDSNGVAHVLVTNMPIVVPATNQVAQAAPAVPLPVVTHVPIMATNVQEQLMVVTNADARYTFTSRGGGLKLVELTHYPEAVSRIRKKKEPIRRVATLNTDSTLPVLGILGSEAVQGDDNFSLMNIPDGVRAEKVLENGLRIVKDFQLTNNYLIHVSVRLENVSTQTLQLPVQEWAVGTATPMNAQDKGGSARGGMTVGTMWYDGAKTDDKNDAWFENRSFGCMAGTPRAEFVSGVSNVVWAAVHNQFFALAVIPAEPAQAIIVRKVNMPPPSAEELTNAPGTVADPTGFATTLVYPAMTLTATQSVERGVTIYAGPKEYRTLARVGGQLNNNLDAVMGFGTTFFGKISSIFSKALLLSMNGLHAAIKLPYGWAIIFITVFIKLLFWPLTQASTRSMKRMQVLQPQMTAIREKYKEDPVKMNRKVMEFMKENKVNPMSGCWPMLIQMPVFIGFFTMLRTAIELRGAPFLWIGDLSQPDTLFIIPGLSLPFIGTPDGLPFNLLPLIMGVVMLWQSHLTPASPGMDPAQQKMMRYLPLIFLLFLYNYSSGLALYWTTNNLLTILQTKLTKNITVAAPPSPLTPLSKKSKP